MGTNGSASPLVKALADRLSDLGYAVKIDKNDIHRNRPDLIVSRDSLRTAIEISFSPLTVAKVHRLGNLVVDRVLIGMPKNRLYVSDSRVKAYLTQHTNISICQFDSIDDLIACLD